MRDEIITKSGRVLRVETGLTDDGIEVSLQMERGRKCLLHWGVRSHPGAPWEVPPNWVWPEGSLPFDKAAVQTPFVWQNGEGRITIRFDRSTNFSSIDFALFFPEADCWDNNSGSDYQIKIPKPDRLSRPELEALLRKGKDSAPLYEYTHILENGGLLGVSVEKNEKGYRLMLITDLPGPLTLHWGLTRTSRYGWTLPPPSLWPAGTTVFQKKAAQSPFVDKGQFRELRLVFLRPEAPMGISFVLQEVQTRRWLKEQGRNLFVPVAVASDFQASTGDSVLAHLTQEIIEKEMGSHSWTLMHRFTLCYELLDRVGNHTDSLALIFVWLRFSAIRQLDWQRDYNTKPRELSHAMDRLTLKLADRYKKAPAQRELIRLIMTTMGRGGQGQRVRDEILNIMHRHHLKEVSAHFMEEWHQKLHNNTTPDDVVICQAYIAFLKSNGHLGTFYRILKEGGVSKERLEGYERPIRSHPDFMPHLKEVLIHDFEQFLGILQGVHSSADLGSAIDRARHVFDAHMQDLMDFLWRHGEEPKAPVTVLVEKITKGRRWLRRQMGKDHGHTRDLLFLDLALEDFFRLVVERTLHAGLTTDTWMALVAMAMENLLLSKDDEELEHCLGHWKDLKDRASNGERWALEAKAVLDRVGRGLGTMMDDYFHLFGPKARLLGRAFHAAPWTITRFTDEVVRARPAFVLSALAGKMEPILRNKAHLGDWQVISPGRKTGRVLVVDTLMSVQGNRYSEPTVMVTNKVAGEEEIPDGVTAIITADSTDIVSHVAIRARNAHVVLATCHNQETMAELSSLKGRWITLSTDGASEVDVKESPVEERTPVASRMTGLRLTWRPAFTSYAISARDFSEKNVGGKSNNLIRLKGTLPEWLYVPASVALPFGVFERVLSEEGNKEMAGRYEELSQKADQEEGAQGVLDELRKMVMALEAPAEMASPLRLKMKEAGLPWPREWQRTWNCIKGVWASKWNQRAYLSRRAGGIPHRDLFMAVLIQELVEAEYSFVIHTVNPISKDRGEIVAEIVPGLGETLVGNYPGKAFSFSCRKAKDIPRLLDFPSKSTGLFGRGLIFRSDSNGEDLAGYAGAGLYESITLERPRKVSLDYTKELLLTDDAFQYDFLLTVARIGTVVEQVLGAPQDIEGAYGRGKYWIVQTRPQVGTEDE
jgi:alpha-glucan,water dikinase